MILARTIAKLRVLAAERRIRLAYADLDRVEASAKAEIEQRHNAITVASSRLCEARADYRALTKHSAYLNLQAHQVQS